MENTNQSKIKGWGSYSDKLLEETYKKCKKNGYNYNLLGYEFTKDNSGIIEYYTIEHITFGRGKRNTILLTWVSNSYNHFTWVTWEDLNEKYVDRVSFNRERAIEYLID